MKMLSGRLLGIACVAVLCGTLWAGLWPFHAPKNAVSWLKDGNGLSFGNAGTIYSSGDVPLNGPPDSGCSIEVWARPANRWGSGTLLSFGTLQKPNQFTVHQSQDDLLLKSGDSTPGRFYSANAFAWSQPEFLAITSGLQGTAVYIDGALVRTSRRFRVQARECAGQVVVGTSALNNDNWAGDLRGLAVYHRELTVSGMRRHYESWAKTGRPEVAPDEACAALYQFDEHAGTRVQNRVGSRETDLLIPDRFMIQEQTFLMPFWEEFSWTGGYWRSFVKNVVGLIPLGFCFYACFLSKASPRRAAWMTIMLGAMVSVTIEVLQSFLPTRQSGTTDIFTNTFGTWLGVLLWRHMSARIRMRP